MQFNAKASAENAAAPTGAELSLIVYTNMVLMGGNGDQLTEEEQSVFIQNVREVRTEMDERGLSEAMTKALLIERLKKSNSPSLQSVGEHYKEDYHWLLVINTGGE